MKKILLLWSVYAFILNASAQADGGAGSFGSQRVAAMHTSGLGTVKLLLQAGGRK